MFLRVSLVRMFRNEFREEKNVVRKFWHYEEVKEMNGLKKEIVSVLFSLDKGSKVGNVP